MRNSIAILALALFAASPAQASDSALFEVDGVGGSLPSDFAQITLGASRRAVKAKVVDWEDDLRAIQPKRDSRCWAFPGNRGLTLTDLASVQALHGLPASVAGESEDPFFPLRRPLRYVAATQLLTDDEARALERVASTRVEDSSDRLRVMIDGTWLLMRISERAYQERVAYHMGRTKGARGFLRKGKELCRAYSYQVERDEQFILAGRRIVAFYVFLERELGD